MATREVYLTREGRESLDRELKNLTAVRRPEVVERIHKANQSGGTVDNAEYEEAKKEQALVDGRIRELEDVLFRAIVASKGDSKKGVVGIGSSVTVADSDGGKQRYAVVGSAEAAPLERKISNESPVGQALMGRKAGDQIAVDTPAGKLTLTITRVT